MIYKNLIPIKWIYISIKLEKNHAVTIHGHIGADLITMASMLRIPVSMHNVHREKIYRPHSWTAFGAENEYASDYMACKNYGPMYK